MPLSKLEGRATIAARHIKRGARLHELMRSVNSNSIAIISQSLCGGWLAIRLDFLGAMISAFGKSP